jgi:hypothetical protein
MIRLGLFRITHKFYAHLCACHSSEFSLHVPVAVHVKGMSLNIKDYRKIIKISEAPKISIIGIDNRSNLKYLKILLIIILSNIAQP